jgi:hypothetical protein
MHGFGSHTYSLINAAGERVYVKWHFLTQQGIKNLSADEATRIAGTDPDYAQRDLFNAIAQRRLPALGREGAGGHRRRTGRMGSAHRLESVRPDQGLAARGLPAAAVGVLELNRNPVNYHAEVEQAALSPSNVVPGMGYSPDKMLQARLFASRCAAVPRRHQPPAPAGERALPVPQSSARRCDGAPTVARRRTTIRCRRKAAIRTAWATANRRWRWTARPAATTVAAGGRLHASR